MSLYPDGGGQQPKTRGWLREVIFGQKAQPQGETRGDEGLPTATTATEIAEEQGDRGEGKPSQEIKESGAIGGAGIGGGAGNGGPNETEDQKLARQNRTAEQHARERAQYALGGGPKKRNAAKAEGMREVADQVEDLLKSKGVAAIVMHEGVLEGRSAPDARPPWTVPLVAIIAEPGKYGEVMELYKDLLEKLPVREKKGGEPSSWITVKKLTEWERGGWVGPRGELVQIEVQHLGAQGIARVRDGEENRWREVEKRRCGNVIDWLRSETVPNETELRNLGLYDWYNTVRSQATEAPAEGISEAVRDIGLHGTLGSRVAPGPGSEEQKLNAASWTTALGVKVEQGEPMMEREGGGRGGNKPPGPTPSVAADTGGRERG